MSAAAAGPTASQRAASGGVKRWLEATRTNQDDKVVLSRVLGHTCARPTSLVCHPTQTAEFAYTCGSVCALYDQRAHAQKRFYTGRRGHELACLTFSEDGAWLAAGERGKQAAVLIWDVATGERIALLLGHAHSITHVKFSPLKDYLAVVAEEEVDDADATSTRSNLTIWRLSDRRSVWSHTFSEADFSGRSSAADVEPPHGNGVITSIDWSCDNTYFAVAGHRYLHYYYLRESATASPLSPPHSAQSLLTLERQEAKLGVHEQAEFVSIACGTGALAQYTFGLSNKGVLCAFTLKDRVKKKGAVGESQDDLTSSAASPSIPMTIVNPNAPRRWEIEKWVDLRLPQATHLSLVKGVLAMSGADSKVRVFEASKLEHIATLGKPAPLLADKTKYPATMLCALTPDALKVVAVYSDRAMVVWDARDTKKKPFHAWQAHSGCIWDIALIPNPPTLASKRRAFDDIDYDSDEDERERAAAEARRKYPDDSFVTCSTDNSIRVWNVTAQPTTSSSSAPKWSGDCLASVYVPPPPEVAANTAGLRCLKFIPSDAASSGPTGAASAAPSLSTYPHGLIASGDQLGNVRLHNLSDLKQLVVLEAHDKEVRSLDFHQQARADGKEYTTASLPLLVSGSRDSMVHVHSLQVPSIPQSCTPQEVHTATVTQVRLTTLPATPASAEQLLLVSGGMDKQLSIRRVVPESTRPLSASSIDLDVAGSGPLHFERSNIVDIVVHPTRKFMAVLCNNADKKSQAAAAAAAAAATPTAGDRTMAAKKPVNCIVKMIDLASGRESRQYSIQTLGNGDPIRMCLDPSGILLAISFSDKSILLLDWYSGAVLTTFYAHSQVVTALQFTQNCRSLLTVASDGCICVWKIDEQYVKAMHARRKELQPATTKSAEAAQVAQVVGKRSTAMDYLDDSDASDAEELDLSPTKEKSPPPALAVPATPVSAPGLPHLGDGGEFHIGRQASLSGIRKVLPTWARSTVVSPESGDPSSGAAPSFPSGMGVGLSGGVDTEHKAPNSVRNRWAQRIEVDDHGVPQAIVADSNKVYGTMGTIGVGTMLLDSDVDTTDVDVDGPKPTDEEEVIDIETDDDLDEEAEEDSEEFVRENFRAGGARAPEPADQNSSNVLRSSMTSQFLRKLKEDNGLGVKPAGSTVPASKLGLPTSYVEREAKTTTEVAQIRQQLRSMGILEDPTGQHAAATAARTTVAAGPTEPMPCVSPNASIILSSSGGGSAARLTSAAADSSTAVAQVSRSVETSVRPPVMPPGVHASLASLPSAAQNLAVHRDTIEAFQASLQNLLCAFGQVKQAQVAARPHTAATGGSLQLADVPSVSVSFAHHGASPSSGLASSVAVIPVLPSSSFPSGNSHSLVVPGHDAVRGSVSFPSVAQSALGRPAAAGTTDLDTLASVYEEQLKTMQAVLAQVLPPMPIAVTASAAHPAPLMLRSPDDEPAASSSSPSPPSTFLTDYPFSPTAGEHAHMQSMELSLTNQYDRMSERLAEMVLRKMEAKIAMGGTGMLSTTQQLALGMTLSSGQPATSAQPPHVFSSAPSQ